MTAFAALMAAAAAALACWRPAAGVRRLGDLKPARPRERDPLSHQAATALAGMGLAVVVGMPVGLLVGLLVTLAGPAALARLEPAAVRRDREQLVADLPLMLDLLASCLAGGAGLSSAAGAVAAAVPGPCGRRLTAVADALAVGMAPGEAWLCLAAGCPDDPLASAARVLGRAAEGGAPVAAAVGRSAAEARAVSRAAGAQAARRVGVLVVAPLGLCFLPAFVLLGVVPVVAGLAGPLFATF